MKQLLFVALLSVTAAACKQGKGDRCQINADCADGLVCNQATQTCADTTGTGIDATLPKDAAPADAPHDAPHDAAPDAPDAH